MSTCRVCGEYTEHGPLGPMIKYGVRHYAHATCAMNKWGIRFFDRLTDWQVTKFPYLIAKRYGYHKCIEQARAALAAADKS